MSDEARECTFVLYLPGKYIYQLKPDYALFVPGPALPPQDGPRAFYTDPRRGSHGVSSDLDGSRGAQNQNQKLFTGDTS